jgi:hypothetical protein
MFVCVCARAVRVGVRVSMCVGVLVHAYVCEYMYTQGHTLFCLMQRWLWKVSAGCV